ncbi:fimbrial biogenesis chaperone [Bordetella genomosp. 12]|uniref:Fimbrial chaperone protein n=1 Tax=Bordetella genomosp. 12 TaxID=463035 RepID=A0A261VU04_9BORD|nr:molecular chaperone [Bordetella genomosp. 12]OZI77307.1 fimbrial chaperone protein [Bordetella genomosp. 12]
MKLRPAICLYLGAFLWPMAVPQADAAVQLSSTRLIFEEGKRSAAVYAKNLGEPVVVQAWIEGVGEKMETPFFITPPLSRFDGDTERSLTVTRVGDNVPQDRESYYWINVLEIPQKAQSTTNTLAFATRTRIKLFYRPAAIRGLPRGPEQLGWTVQRGAAKCQLSIANASAFNVNFSKLVVSGLNQEVGRGVVALPLTTTTVELASCPPPGSTITPHVVNDYGAFEAWPAVTPQSGGTAARPR